MLKRKYVKRIYVEEPYCDKCGARMHYTKTILSRPPQYLYKCTNENCDESQIFLDGEIPGVLRYEFEDNEVL